ncbi:hypothetical protein G3I44_14135 [Halogeometricum borinquense]|uniref:Uncharacterized protein n=1 Tax=Halogeometricum borinquense TaxID=60847 RepID=A0A6C0UII2_9EURY|nr:hypothetical protein [Halogeometricum borinquense]QIB75326.1 hypothetical protein G3I44_14135 [Halogeometricum borinquense]
MSQPERGENEVFIEGYHDELDSESQRAEYIEENPDASIAEYSPTSIDPFDGKAALDDSGRFYNLLGVDVDGRAHYLKDRSRHGDIRVLDEQLGVVDDERIEYKNVFNPQRLASYVVETEWAAVNEYGMAWALDYFDEDEVLEP